MTGDAVNRPEHYTFGKYEVIDVLMDWFPADPLLWQVGKYIAHAGRKGPMLEDLQKTVWYLNKRIEREKAAAFCSGCPREGWHKGSPHWCYKFGQSTMGVTGCGEKIWEEPKNAGTV
jgi:hypothetical protein